MTALLLLVMTLVALIGWVFYAMVKRDNRDLRRFLLADDAGALWLYMRDNPTVLQWHYRDDRTSARSPDGAVRKHRAAAEAVRRVEAELREDA